MQKYFFLNSALPPLELSRKSEMAFEEVLALYKDTLSAREMQKIALLTYWADLNNLRAFWQGAAFDSHGTLSVKEMEEALSFHTYFKPAVFDYLTEYADTPSRIKHFPKLLAQFLKEQSNYPYWKEEREQRLVLTALRAKYLGRDLRAELQFEDPEEPFIEELLAQKDAKSFEPPEEYGFLKGLMQGGFSPADIEKALLSRRLDALSDAMEGLPFSFERLEAYLCSLILIERWQELSAERGLQLIDTLVKDSL